MPRLLAPLSLAGFAFASVPARGAVVQPFPDGFLWGTAISAFQSEMGVGAPNDTGTDWWVWVHDQANLDAGRVSRDRPEDGPGFYELYKTDARLARKQLGGNAL